MSDGEKKNALCIFTYASVLCIVMLQTYIVMIVLFFIIMIIILSPMGFLLPFLLFYLILCKICCIQTRYRRNYGYYSIREAVVAFKHKTITSIGTLAAVANADVKVSKEELLDNRRICITNSCISSWYT